MTTKRTNSALGGSDLRPGHIVLGDSICPTRYGAGVTVDDVKVEGNRVMVYTFDGSDFDLIELLPSETVYVKGDVR